ncbi:hypothetical protein [Erythrobacter alti]|uniref:hypothetical protein n=1 Tax=Erythrobacter alti TaxID=1896145 RepID=UPI0030F49B0D
MSQKFDASTWTGLTNDGRIPDVREAQHPVSGTPAQLPVKTFRGRIFNWSILAQLSLMWFAIALVSRDWTSANLLAMSATIFGGFVIVSVGMHFWSRHRRETVALRLSEDGLHLPLSYTTPVPWQHIGWIEQHLWRGFRTIAIQVDPQFQLEAKPPWPLSLFRLPNVKSRAVPLTLSCWAINAGCDDLIAELRQYRDNYCAAGPRA